VGARHLNGKWGTVLEKESSSTNGRVVVHFYDNSPSGIIEHPGPPKLVNPARLRRIWAKQGKYHPFFCLSIEGERVMVRIEKGEGKSCVNCGCDLAGRYYVLFEGANRCEQHFAERFLAYYEMESCSICRKLVHLPRGILIPHGIVKLYLPDTNPNDGANGEGVLIHIDCFVCSL